MAGVANVDDNLRRTLQTLNERLHRLEMTLNPGDENARPSVRSEKRRVGGRRLVTCWNCGGKGHIARACKSLPM